jgi:RHS repeat-associated protein
LNIANSGATRSYAFTTTPEYLIKQIAESAPSGSAWAPQTWKYGYDNNDRLTQGQSSNGSQYTYGYDAADNINSLQTPAETVSPSLNADNQITSFAGRSFVYDANGNLTDDGQRTYKWDAENRLIEIASKTTPAQASSFVYDGFSRRVASFAGAGAAPVARAEELSVVRRPVPRPALTRGTVYLWCGDTLCGSKGPGRSGRSYYPEGEYIAGVGTSLYYQQDHLGSVRDVVSGPTGSRVAAFDYDPYGNPIQRGGTVTTDFRYAGMFYDQQDDLYLTQYRAYSPSIGRWLSRDPIGIAGGLNEYTYVENNPASRADSNGKQFMEVEPETDPELFEPYTNLRFPDRVYDPYAQQGPQSYYNLSTGEHEIDLSDPETSESLQKSAEALDQLKDYYEGIEQLHNQLLNPLASLPPENSCPAGPSLRLVHSLPNGPSFFDNLPRSQRFYLQNPR